MGESLSEKISSILSTAPASFDPEDDVHDETTARVVSDKAEGVGDDDDFGLSQFRKQNVDLLGEVDSRYEGKPSSRRRLQDSEDEESDDDQSIEDDDDGSEVSLTNNDEESDQADEEIDQDDKTDEDGGSTTSDEDEEDPKIGQDETFTHIREEDSARQAQKGSCVRNQLSMWENLLEMRIQMQKCLVAANKFPQADIYTDLKQEKQFVSSVNGTRQHITELLDKLLMLQSLLLKQYPETSKMLSDRKTESKADDDEEEVPSDTEEEDSIVDDDVEERPHKRRKLSDYGAEIVDRHNLYKDYRNSVIQKWNDKTRMAVTKSNTGQHSIINHIEHILSSTDKLVKKTQLKRTDYDIVGKIQSKSQEEYDSNIFDDTDFYHHLLRELIEFKAADVTDPVQLGRQWTQLQNLRSKMKRPIDTKATKGRKIRYVVHSKLVNYMAPIDDSSWTEEAKSELFSSLFGKL